MEEQENRDRTSVRSVRVFVIGIVIMVLSGCASLPQSADRDVSERLALAVLPLRNDTNDVDGPAVVQEKMAGALTARGLRVRTAGTSDHILRDEFGVTLGGQLDGVDPRKLGEALNVDALLYGILLDFNETTLGVYNVRKVRAVFRLVSTATGSVLWERGLGVRSEQTMAGRAGDAATVLGRLSDPRDAEAPWVTIERIEAGRSYQESLAIGLGTRLLTKALGIHLEREATALARMITDDFPLARDLRGGAPGSP